MVAPNPSWQTDLNWSKRMFANLVQPVLEAELGGEFFTIETTKLYSELWWLDSCGGVDYLWRRGPVIYGVAARVQRIRPNARPYNTFTIRERRQSCQPTELAKLSSDGLRPSYHIQAYVSTGESPQLLSVGVVRTGELLGFIQTHPDRVLRRQTTNAEFLAVPFNGPQGVWCWP